MPQRVTAPHLLLVVTWVVLQTSLVAHVVRAASQVLDATVL